MTDFTIQVSAKSDLSHLIVCGNPKHALELFGVVRSTPPTGWTITTPNPELIVSRVFNISYAIPTRHIHFARDHVINNGRIIICNVVLDDDDNQKQSMRTARFKIRRGSPYNVDILYFLVYENEDEYLINKIKDADKIGKEIPIDF